MALASLTTLIAPARPFGALSLPPAEQKQWIMAQVLCVPDLHHSHRRTVAANSPEHYCSLPVVALAIIVRSLSLSLSPSSSPPPSLPPSPPSPPRFPPRLTRAAYCASYVLDAGASPLEFSQRAWHIKNLRPLGLAASLA